MERRRHTRHPITLPLEYWETDDSSYGGLVSNVSEAGLLIYSVRDIPVNKELCVRVFFSNGYKFDGLSVTAKVLWKKLHHETDWKIYKYGLEFTRVAEGDRRKLEKLIMGHLASQNLSVKKAIGVRNPQSEKPGYNPSPRLDQNQEKKDTGGADGITSGCEAKDLNKHCSASGWKHIG